MSPTLDAFLRSWPSDPWLLAALVVTACVYLRGWSALRRRDPTRWHAGQAWAFLGGLGALYLALASPLEAFADLLLQCHMAQHLLLMMAVPPLVWLGAPQFPLLRGIPEPIRTVWLAPLLRSPMLGCVFGRLTHPLAALFVLTAVTWIWHTPAAYELALRSPAWHYVQHMCFLAAGLLFWYPVVRPYPARPRWSQWLLVPSLILADIQNTVLSALLTFADTVIYPHYAEAPHLAGWTALADQATAGVLMWVPGSLTYLLPLFAIGVRLLCGGESAVRSQESGIRSQESVAPARIPLPVLVASSSPRRSQAPGFDLLNVPIIGRFMKWRHARLVMQVPVVMLAVIVAYDGWWGTSVTPMNLAGVLPWIHWRGIVIVGLLVAGNAFCMACPFMLPRTLGRRWLPARWTWPRRLRNKWLAVLLLALFLWAYEAFALWDSPWWTAWLILVYFTAAFVVDGVFRGASFCKYLCPIGQFNFVQSLVSPLEVRVRDANVCTTCRTKDCIRGRPDVRGCELELYLPRKAGNMDCTFCLDCIHACPHDNIGILSANASSDPPRDGPRSGVGRFARRPDLAALVLVLVFGAFANAAGMIEPVVELERRAQSLLALDSALPIICLFYAGAILVLPAASVGIAAALSRYWAGSDAPWLTIGVRYAYALVPLGSGMWLAHYSFHFLTSYEVIVPASQRFLAGLGVTGLGDMTWVSACCPAVPDWLDRLQIVFLELAALLSLYVAYRIAMGQTGRPALAVRAAAPWAALIVLLFAAGVWIILQPMQMRGAM